MSLNNESVAHEREAILGRMREEIEAICAEAPKVWQHVLSQADGVTTPGPMVITGCGDSYYAGLAMRQAIEGMTGRPVVTWPAMDVVSYPSSLLEQATLVAVSVSGKVGRTIEAVAAHQSRAGSAVGVTTYDDSDLGRAADAVIATGVRGTPGPVPGTANYVASMLGLLALGAAQTTDDRVRSSVEDVLRELPALYERASSFFREQVASITEPVFTVGSGPDWGTANYAVAKLLEAAAAVGVPQDLEEWAHEQYFATTDRRSVVVFGMDEPSRAGAQQAVAMTAAVDGSPIAVGGSTAGSGHPSLEMPDVPPGLSPLLTWLPAAVLALEFALHHDRFPFGIDKPGRMETVDRNIYVPAPSRA